MILKSAIRSRKFVISLFLFVFIFIVDQVTKYQALSGLHLGESHVLFTTDPLSIFFTLIMNKGAAWGVGSLYPIFLFVIRACILCALFFFWKRLNKMSFYLLVTLIITGALSNMMDCFFRGAVVDFIHLRFFTYDYPIFNVADGSIFCGTLGLILTYPFQIPQKNNK